MLSQLKNKKILTCTHPSTKLKNNILDYRRHAHWLEKATVYSSIGHSLSYFTFMLYLKVNVPTV